MNKTDKKALLPYNLYSGGAITWKLSEICNVADTVNAQKKRGVQDATGSTDFFFPASLHSKKTSSNATASSFIIVTSSNVCLHLPWTFLFFLKDFIYLFIFLRCFIYLFSETGRDGEREERNSNVWLPLARPLLGTWPAPQACALTGNWTGTLGGHFLIQLLSTFSSLLFDVLSLAVHQVKLRFA